jgi:hypothetical protein
LDSGRTHEIIIAEQRRDGIIINDGTVQDLKAAILQNDIGLVIIDPFVSSHRVAENDNNSIDRVVKVWAHVADETGCAVELVHHTSKTYGNEVTVEHARGASALIGATRSARVLNVMSQHEAAKAGVSDRRRFVRVENGKDNMSPPSDKAEWGQLVSVSLDNGTHPSNSDTVGVWTSWSWPAAAGLLTAATQRAVQKAVAGGRWREHHSAKDWVGHAIAQALGRDLTMPAEKALVREIQRTMTARGLLKNALATDAKRNERLYVEVGRPVTD